MVATIDLAKLYNCTNGTKDINKAVKRNIDRFPEEFYFELFPSECSRFQSGTLNTKRGQNIKYLPHAFTEQGVAMLASVLHTEKAIKTSIQIMNAFVLMRHYVLDNVGRISNIEQKVIEHDNRLQLVENIFDNFKEVNNHIYFKGEIYDAYSLLLDILNKAKKEIIIIDNYINKNLLDIIKDLKCNVILITSNKTKLTKLDIEKYNETYDNLRVIYDDTYHDRYFIIDRDKIYHSGNSINHIGQRKSNINLLEDKKVKNMILEDVNDILKR